MYYTNPDSPCLQVILFSESTVTGPDVNVFLTVNLPCRPQ